MANIKGRPCNKWINGVSYRTNKGNFISGKFIKVFLKLCRARDFCNQMIIHKPRKYKLDFN